MCSEFSILAQSYLESHGIDSYLCDAHLFQETSGGILYEAHHFWQFMTKIVCLYMIL